MRVGALYTRSLVAHKCNFITTLFFQPRNIFLQGLRHPKEERDSFQVKIGDFGLARKEVVVSPGASSPLASLIEPLTPLFSPGMKVLYYQLNVLL